MSPVFQIFAVIQSPLKKMAYIFNNFVILAKWKLLWVIVFLLNFVN
jgi:hypothetical protein